MARTSKKTELGNRHSAPVLAVSEPERLPQGDIRTNGGTQMRAGLRDETVSNYQEIMEAANGWGSFPPVEVVYDGEIYWLTDGFHRLAAASKLFAEDYPVPVVVTPGDFDAALLAAAKANDKHGLPRSNADKRRAVINIMTKPKWQGLSDSLIAEMCAVTPRFVGAVREDLVEQGAVVPSTVRTGKDGRVMETARVGRQPAPKPAPVAQHDGSGLLEGHEFVAAKTGFAPITVVAPEPVVTFESTVPQVSEGPERPGELLTVVLRRDFLVSFYEALTSGVLRMLLTPEQMEHGRKAVAKTLNQGVRT